jgi:hypothetical protein
MALINRTYAIANPRAYPEYGERCWGLTASDDPWGYSAHEAKPDKDNGTITPTGALASFPYTPQESMTALKYFYRDLGDRLWGVYGFHDAFNLKEGWFARIYVGLDQAPITVMIENYRSGLVWKSFMANPEIGPALQRAGFREDRKPQTGGFMWRATALLIVAGVPPALSQDVVVDARAASRLFHHFWERALGSGRANLTLRESYREDLRKVKEATGFEYVRFHAIFHDENGVYDEDAQGNPVYNWSYVDQIYDGLLQNKVKPFVELSFMPSKLASSQKPHPFWHRPLPAPPREYDRWAALIEAFARHLVDRYGIDEVAGWPFEVWNEPNIDFWAGEPKEETYKRLYRVTVLALTKVSPRTKVGGPSTAQAAWVGKFIDYCA